MNIRESSLERNKQLEEAGESIAILKRNPKAYNPGDFTLAIRFMLKSYRRIRKKHHPDLFKEC